MTANWTKITNDLESSIQTAQLLLQKLTSMAEAKSMALNIKEEKRKIIDWEKVNQEANALILGQSLMKNEIERQLMAKGFSVRWSFGEGKQFYDFTLGCHIQDEDGFPIKVRMAEDYVKDMIDYAQKQCSENKCFYAAFYRDSIY